MSDHLSRLPYLGSVLALVLVTGCRPAPEIEPAPAPVPVAREAPPAARTPPDAAPGVPVTVPGPDETVVRNIPYQGAFGPSDPPGAPMSPMQKPLEPWVQAAMDVWYERPSPKGPPAIPLAQPRALFFEGKGPVIQVLPGPPAFPEKIPSG